MTNTKLIKLLDSQHEAYDKNLYRIIAQTAVQNDNCNGVLRCFTYRDNPRFAVLFESTPDSSKPQFRAL